MKMKGGLVSLSKLEEIISYPYEYDEFLRKLRVKFKKGCFISEVIEFLNQELPEDCFEDNIKILVELGLVTIGTAIVKNMSIKWHKANNKSTHITEMDYCIGKVGVIFSYFDGTTNKIFSLEFKNGDSWDFSENVLEDIDFHIPIPTGKDLL